MKKYSLLVWLLTTGMYVVAQSWAKEYDRVDACNCGLALVKKAGKFGYVSEKGKLIIPLIYDEGLAFSEDKAAVSILGKWGFVDTKGNEFVRPQYNEVYSFHDGLAVVAKSGSYGYIDTAGSIAIPFQFSNAGNFAEGIAPASNAKKLWGYIDRTGKEVIPFRFNYATAFTEGAGRVLLNDSWYKIDIEGNLTKFVQ